MNKFSRILFIILIVAAFAAGVYLYPQLPEKIASHWGVDGNADDYMGKFWGIFLLPIIMLGLFLIYLVIPKVDPLKENIERFRRQYDGFWIFMALFMLYVYGLQLAWNLGGRFDFGRMMIPALTILLYVSGIVIGKAKRNWFVGIRTPWTLSNDIVWDKTHRLGAKLFKMSAVIVLVGFFVPGKAIWFILMPVFATVIWAFVYSYLEYRKIAKFSQMRIVLATGNPSKAVQIRAIFEDLDINVVTLAETGIEEEAPETGETLEENALQKAMFAHEKTDGWVMADDSGIFINALGGAPGIHSARWAGDNAETDEITAYTLEQLKGKSDRTATFKTAVALVDPEGKERFFYGEAPGRILENPRTKPQPKMPYSPIFVPDGEDMCWAEMEVEYENKISHRGRAFKKVREFLKNQV